MNEIVVAISSPFEDEFTARFAEVSPQLRVVKIQDLVRQEFQLLRSTPDSPERKRTSAELDSILQKTEVVLTGFRLPHDMLARAPRLRWIQSKAAGVDRVADSGIAQRGIVVTNARGVAAVPIAEWILCTMLMFAKRMHLHQKQKLQHVYQREGQPPFSLEGKTIGVLGVGAIGTETARLARCAGMRVLATRRTIGGPMPPHVDRLYGPGETDQVLRESDFVAVTLPLTAETHHVIGERELRQMKRTAYILNVGRGPIIDEAALAQALREGWIAGAALDVFEKEPLPPESPLWDLDNVIFSPHISGNVDDYDRRVAQVFVENLRRYVAGESLMNIVDLARGY